MEALNITEKIIGENALEYKKKKSGLSATAFEQLVPGLLSALLVTIIRRLVYKSLSTSEISSLSGVRFFLLLFIPSVYFFYVPFLMFVFIHGLLFGLQNIYLYTGERARLLLFLETSVSKLESMEKKLCSVGSIYSERYHYYCCSVSLQLERS